MMILRNLMFFLIISLINWIVIEISIVSATVGRERIVSENEGNNCTNKSLEISHPHLNISYVHFSNTEENSLNLLSENDNLSFRFLKYPRVLVFKCEAPYPIEWQFETLGIRSEFWYINTGRLFNSTPERYTSFLNLTNLSTRSLLAINPICKSSKDSCLQSSVSTTYEKDGEYTLKIIPVSNVKLVPVNPRGYKTDTNCSINLQYVKELKQFQCESLDLEKKKPKVYVRPCTDFTKCNLEAMLQPSKCQINLPKNLTHLTNCKDPYCTKLQLPSSSSSSSMTNYYPANAYCILEGDDESNSVAVSLPYFYSVDGNQIYFNWVEADPQDMIRMTNLTEQTLYTKQAFEISCNGSFYYFISGLYFELYSLSHDGSHYVKESLSRFILIKNEEILSTQRGYYNRNMKSNRTITIINFSSNMPKKYRIYCFAPVWNSTEYVNQSVDFTILESKPPIIFGKNESLTSEEFNGTKCIARGTPRPTIDFYNFKKEKFASIFRREIGFGNDSETIWAKIIIPSQIKQVTSEYLICTSENFAGEASKYYFIKRNVDDDSAQLSAGSWALIGSAIFLIALLVLVLILLSFKVRKQNIQLRMLTQEEIDEFKFGRPDYLPLQADNSYAYYLPYNDSYEIPKEKLYIDKNILLGSGAFGQVYSGIYKKEKDTEDIKVAVKTIRSTFDDVITLKSLLSELKMMAFIKEHPNIVNLIGACTKNINNRQVYIAIEFCENGSLLEYLHKNGSTMMEDLNTCGKMIEIQKQHGYIELENFARLESNGRIRKNTSDPPQFVKWAKEIAFGMDFLASKSIIHADLATRNCLLTRDLIAKISDFGLSKRLNYVNSNYLASTKTALPWRWLSIEILENLEFSLQSDVWAYGVLMYEIFTLGKVPYEKYSFPSLEFLQNLKSGMRLEKPSYSSDSMYSLMQTCWNADKNQRPNFNEILTKISLMMLKSTPNDYTTILEE